MASIDEIMSVFSMLAANYHYAMRDMSPKQVSDLQVLWCELLRDLDGDILKAAALQHVSESKWFPSIAELRDAAAQLMTPDRMTPVEAWGEVVRAFSYPGRYGNPQFNDPITAEVINDLGWIKLCDSEMQETDRARFIQGYMDRLKRERRLTTELPQVAEVRNRIKQIARARCIPQIEGKR